MVKTETAPRAKKRMRARQIRDWPSNLSLIAFAKPMTNSGESAAVKASLKVKADEMSSDVVEIAARNGMPSRFDST